MRPTTLLSLMLLSSLLTGCGVLFPEPPERIVLTKTELKEKPVILEALCPPPPSPPPKRSDGKNTLAKDYANWRTDFDGWAMACRDLNEALDAILRPSKEALRPSQ